MVFEINRASIWNDKPCDEAYKTEITYTNGWNKTTTRQIYAVNINTLEELVEFVEQKGKIVIYPKGNSIPEITIYDDWIE